MGVPPPQDFSESDRKQTGGYSVVGRFAGFQPHDKVTILVDKTIYICCGSISSLVEMLFSVPSVSTAAQIT